MATWIVLAVAAGARVHGGNDAYADDADAAYHWDSTVAHHQEGLLRVTG